jgi:hypothetical protein
MSRNGCVFFENVAKPNHTSRVVGAYRSQTSVLQQEMMHVGIVEPIVLVSLFYRMIRGQARFHQSGILRS